MKIIKSKNYTKNFYFNKGVLEMGTDKTAQNAQIDLSLSPVFELSALLGDFLRSLRNNKNITLTEEEFGSLQNSSNIISRIEKNLNQQTEKQKSQQHQQQRYTPSV